MNFSKVKIGETEYNIKDEQARNSISEINSNIELIKSERTICIGDSYLVGGASNGTNWGDLYKSYIGLADTDYFKLASNGAGFVATGSGGKTYLQVLQENIDSITDKNTIKRIIVGCGYNDAAYDSIYENMISAIETFTTYCKTNFPNAKVYIIACGYNINVSATDGVKRYNMAKIVTRAYSYHDYTNTPIFLDFSNLWLHNSDWFTEDGIHPNATGQIVIAKKLVKALNGNNYNQLRGTIDCSIFENNTSINVDVYNNDIQLQINEINLTENLPESFNTQNFVEIGTYNSKIIHPMDNHSLRLKCLVCFVDTELNNHLVEGIMSFNTDGKIYLYARTMIDGQIITFNNLTRFLIYGFTDNKIALIN